MIGDSGARRVARYLGVFLASTLACVGVTIDGASGTSVVVNQDGSYAVLSQAPAWSFLGSTGQPLSNLQTNTGEDNVGAYREISFDDSANGPRHGSIRLYTNRPVVLFTVTLQAPAPNAAPFPVFSQYPRKLRHISYSGIFAGPTFYGFGKDSPWVFYDADANCFILSAAMNFQVAETSWGPNKEIVTGISPDIPALPQGFTHQSVLVIGNGINAAFETWGHALTDLSGKTRPPNDADTSLNVVGYWTDRGAAYYYQTEPSLSYGETLQAVRDAFRQQGFPLGYIQLDSWFYPKGINADWRDLSSGIYSYNAAPPLFTPNLKGFQQRIGIPLITHSRWIDKNSPYRQKYQISGNVAVDSQYWDDVARFLGDTGIRVYEQDWLGDQAHTAFDLVNPDAFLDRMSASLARRGVDIQYCMAAPRHFLQASRYNNVTTIRTSQDRFDQTRWTEFLYASRLASAVGAYPFADVAMSGEPDNLLLATLSAGPVGVGDPAGSLNAANLFLVARNDGVIVKPDAPIVPLDASYLNERPAGDSTLIASTYTDFGGVQARYVFAFSRGLDTLAAFSPRDLGFSGTLFVYNYFTGSGRLVGARETFSEPMSNGRAYYVVVPVGQSGVAFLGDRQQFVPLGKKRIAAFSDSGTAEATVLFAAGEASRTLFGYAAAQPAITTAKGTVGAISYDAASQLFTVTVAPDTDQSAVIDILAAPRPAAPCDPQDPGCAAPPRPPGRGIANPN